MIAFFLPKRLVNPDTPLPLNLADVVRHDLSHRDDCSRQQDCKLFQHLDHTGAAALKILANKLPSQV